MKRTFKEKIVNFAIIAIIFIHIAAETVGPQQQESQANYQYTGVKKLIVFKIIIVI